jgi:hypothetical protein
LPESIDAQAALNQLVMHTGMNLGHKLPDIWIAQHELDRHGLDDETMILSTGRAFVLPGSDYSKYLLDLLDQINESMDMIKLATHAIALMAASAEGGISDLAEFARQQLALMSRATGLNLREDPKLIAVLKSTAFKSFNPQAWIRGQ